MGLLFTRRWLSFPLVLILDSFISSQVLVSLPLRWNGWQKHNRAEYIGAMIRLPPTSVALSENDVQFHLRQIDIYHRLLAQGFKKKDIIRYYAEHAAHQSKQLAEPLERAPTWVEMVSSRRIVDDDSGDGADLLPASPIGPPSPQISPPPIQVASAGNAPRQTSLLRFSETASPASAASSLSEQTERSPESEVLPSLRSQTRRYGPRSQTDASNPSEESSITERGTYGPELEKEFLHLTIGSSPPNEVRHDGTSSRDGPDELRGSSVDNKSTVYSRLRPEAEAFKPSSVSPNCSSLATMTNPMAMSSTSHDLVPCNGNRFGYMDKAAAIATSSTTYNNPPSRATWPTTNPRDEDDRRGHTPSSSHESSSVSLPTPLPGTPTSRPRQQITQRTEPRRRRARHGRDTAPSFQIYDDNLPAAVQPQTPADLSRRLILTEREAAYTAPPGQMRGDLGRNRHRAQTISVPEAGEQSPTVRAMGMRERRVREARRSARVTDGSRTGRNRAHTSPTGGVHDQFGHVFDMVWRQELDADRVGDENFENEDLRGQGRGREDIVSMTERASRVGRGRGRG